MKTFTRFAISRHTGLCHACLKALKGEMRECDRALREYDKQIDAALAHSDLSPRSKCFLRRLWYGDPAGGALSLGNRAVHRAAMIASIATLLMLAHSNRAARRGRLRFRMLTTTPDIGISDFDAPVLNLVGVRRNFYIAARRANMDALGFMDLAVIDERCSLSPLRLSAHMHGAARARTQDFRVKPACRTAAPSARPLNQCGLKAIKITAKSRDWGACLKRCHVAHLAYYIRKLTCGLKVPFINKHGERRTRTTLYGWRPEHALRQLECWSHIDALDTAAGVGAGTKWRAKWKALLLDLLGVEGTTRGLHIDHVALEASWARLWRELGFCDLVPVRVVSQ